MEHNLTVENIINTLKTNNCWFETFEHIPVRTSEEAAKIRHGYELKQGAKALIIRVKISDSNKRFVMIVVPGDQKFDNDKVKNIFGAKDIRFATEEEVSQITNGVKPGGIPPFGNIFGLETLVDSTLLENEKIIFNAGDKGVSIAMYSSDYTKIAQPQIVNVI